MISYLDPILFPDQCFVYEIEPNRFVYPIFKNGSSSLIANKSARLLHYDELREVKEIEVYLRDPFERYVSGVQTYLRNLPTDYNRDTVLKMISEFLFLNRHFSLQFHWLMNLSRYSNALITFKSIEDLNTITEYKINVIKRDQTLVDYFVNNQKLHYYLQLDKIIYENFIGKPISFNQIVQFIKNTQPTLYNDIIDRSKKICSVLV